MNTQNSTTPASHKYLVSSDDRKTLPMLLTAVYTPLLLMLLAAIFIA